MTLDPFFLVGKGPVLGRLDLQVYTYICKIALQKYCPNNHGDLKTSALEMFGDPRTLLYIIHIQTPPKEGPVILRVY